MQPQYFLLRNLNLLLKIKYLIKLLKNNQDKMDEFIMFCVFLKTLEFIK